MASDEIWILGATGRSGRAVARRLAEAGLTPVLVGRDPERLTALGTRGRTVVAPTVAAMAVEVRRQQPGVVLNTVGPFTATAGIVADAGLPGSHYLDLANESGVAKECFLFVAVEKTPPYLVAVYNLDQEAISRGRDENFAALLTYIRCSERNEWPGYPEQIANIGLPTWANKKTSLWQ